MHSYHNKLLPNHFDEYFIPLSSIHYHSTSLATSKNLFLPRANSSSGKCSLKFIGPKVWSSIPDDIKLSTTFTFRWKLKKHLLHEEIPNYELQQHFISPTNYCEFQYSVTPFYFIFFVYLLFRIFCVHILCFSAWSTPFVFFCFALFSFVPH